MWLEFAVIFNTIKHSLRSCMRPNENLNVLMTYFDDVELCIHACVYPARKSINTRVKFCHVLSALHNLICLAGTC